jgi:hypothetical protein
VGAAKAQFIQLKERQVGLFTHTYDTDVITPEASSRTLGSPTQRI